MKTYVDTQRHIPVTSVRIKLVGFQLNGDERYVRVVHGLESLYEGSVRVAGELCVTYDALLVGLEVAIGNQLLDSWIEGLARATSRRRVTHHRAASSTRRHWRDGLPTLCEG